MAKQRKRKSKAHQQRAQRRKRLARAGAAAPADLPPFDRRIMEGIMRGMIPELGGGERSPLDEAQEIMYEAFEAQGEHRIALAQQALAISPDCADAYVLLAEHAPTPQEALPLYEQGVAAGERALGEETFREDEGEFWGLLETRPYMRARAGLAECLFAVGRKDEAVEHYRQLLRLNPNDNQGIRYTLAHALLDLDRDEELQVLLREYDDDIRADFVFTKALLAFRQEGDTPRARRLLQEAVAQNEHVPYYLAGNRQLPAEPPPYLSLGGEDEAIIYVGQFLPAWRYTPGALTWLRRTLRVPIPETPPAPRPTWRRLRTALSNLEQDTDEVWQVDARPYPFTISVRGEEVKPWFACVADATHGDILALDVEDERPAQQDVWESLVRAMRHPRQGDPRRPGTIEVRLKTFASTWSAKLQQINIDCRQCDQLEHVDRFLAETPAREQAEQMLPDTDSTEELSQRDFSELPLNAEVVWQVDVRRMTTWLENDGEPVRPRIAAVADCSEGTVLSHELSAEDDAGKLLWDSVIKALWSPLVGEPQRPGEIQVALPEHRDLLAERLAGADIECVTCEKLEILDEMLADLDRAIHGPDQPMGAMVDTPGMPVEQVGRFFTAADAFYRYAPWRRVACDAVIKIEAPQLVSAPWYAVVMGQSGMTVGLVLYEDLNLLRNLLGGDGDDAENGRNTAGLSVFFDDELQMASRDLDAAERYAWPVAGPEAYPTAMRINPGMAVRPPLAWELALIEACLSALPALIDAQAPQHTVRLPADAGEIEMRLVWFDPFEP